MSKFKDYRSLNGSSSRVTKKCRGTESLVNVLTMVGTQTTGSVITNRKGEMRDPIGRIVPRNLTPLALRMDSPEEAYMYELFCIEAGTK